MILVGLHDLCYKRKYSLIYLKNDSLAKKDYSSEQDFFAKFGKIRVPFSKTRRSQKAIAIVTDS